jgi:hypothetical protein
MKNRFTYLVCFFAVLFTGIPINGQEPEVFTRSDFQIRGPVKQLVVRASYGQEQFDFDKFGRLTKSLTRYSEKDYDITYYIFSGDVLKERRDEVYRDGKIDRQVSIARVYHKDTISNQMLEAVSSYDRSITEQLTLQYDALRRLTSVRRAYNEGVDLTELEYEEEAGQQIQHFSINGMRYKTVCIFAADSIKPGYKVTRTVSLRMGIPQTAHEIVEDAQNKKTAEHRYRFDSAARTWHKEQTVKYEYNQDGLIQSQSTYTSKGDIIPPVLKYIYQMDGAKPSNWVRQVLTPENSIVAREISYY